MQIDMHYFAVYALSLLAGFKPGVARTVAACSEYVDHSTDEETNDHKMGGKVISEETAHHFGDTANLNRDDQRRIWVPFHFLPGGQGGDFMQRLMCTPADKNPLADQMQKNHTKLAKASFGPQLIGVSAHILADTYSHQDFSGVSSHLNKVVNKSLKPINATAGTTSYLNNKYENEYKPKYQEEFTLGGFLKKTINRYVPVLAGRAAELLSGALGHGPAFIYPDLPYLKWRFQYESDSAHVKTRTRDNRKDYLAACKRLHQFFIDCGEVNPDLRARKPIPFNSFEENIKEILAVQDGREERSALWDQALYSGDLAPVLSGKHIPEYPKEAWEKKRDNFENLDDPAKMLEQPLYGFYQAASYHRHYTLRELLPANGMVVI